MEINERLVDRPRQMMGVKGLVRVPGEFLVSESSGGGHMVDTVLVRWPGMVCGHWRSHTLAIHSFNSFVQFYENIKIRTAQSWDCMLYNQD